MPYTDDVEGSFPEAWLTSRRPGIELTKANVLAVWLAKRRVGVTSHYEGESADDLRELTSP